MTDYKDLSGWRGYQMVDKKKQSAQAILLCVLLLIVSGIAGAYEHDEVTMLFEDIPHEAAIVRAIEKSRTQEQIETLLPVPVAKAIAERSAYPRTMAGVAHTESGGDHRAIGDGGKAKGLFQVWGSLHGEVPDDIEGQVDQANRMFLKSVEKHGYRTAVSLWKGTPALPEVKAYQQTVLAKVRKMER